MMKRKMLTVALIATSCLFAACTFGKKNNTSEVSSETLAQIRAEIESEMRAEEAKKEEERLASEKAEEEKKQKEAKKAEEEKKLKEEKEASEKASEKASEEAEKKKISLEEEEKKKAEAEAKAKKEAEAKAKKEAEEAAKAEEEAAKAAEELNKARANAMAHPYNTAIEIANQARRENGLTDLSYDGVLSSLAGTRAAEAAQSFSHTRPDGRNCFTILDDNAVVYMTCGENIAAGQQTEEEVMNAWLNSPGHRANILNGAFHKMGLGYYDAGDAYGRYWVTIFTD